jgi:TIMELESS-interacting protein
MEHWAHRLYPKLPFDDVMDRISQLGKKMTVKTYLKKLRLGMDTAMSATVEQDADDENERSDERVEDPADAIFPQASPRRYDDADDEFDEVANELERDRDEEFDRLAAEMEMEREAFSLPDADDLTEITQEKANQDDTDLRPEGSPDKENIPQDENSRDSDNPQ